MEYVCFLTLFRSRMYSLDSRKIICRRKLTSKYAVTFLQNVPLSLLTVRWNWLYGCWDSSRKVRLATFGFSLSNWSSAFNTGQRQFYDTIQQYSIDVPLFYYLDQPTAMFLDSNIIKASISKCLTIIKTYYECDITYSVRSVTSTTLMVVKTFISSLIGQICFRLNIIFNLCRKLALQKRNHTTWHILPISSGILYPDTLMHIMTLKLKEEKETELQWTDRQGLHP